MGDDNGIIWRASCRSQKRIQDADYIIIGAGAGLSSAAGFDYGGQRFEHYFHDFKEGWNPDTTLKTISAFANDIDNWGDGYLVIGAKEKKRTYRNRRIGDF